MKCPRCGGENVIKMGKIYRKGKILQRYYCKDCMDYFTDEMLKTEATEPKISHEKQGVSEKKQESVKSEHPFNIVGKQLVVMKTNRYDNGELKSVMAVTGDALEIPEVRKYVRKMFMWDDKFDDYARSYSDTAYKSIMKELYSLAKKYKFKVVKME